MAGMDGRHVHGREAVREYSTRQWTVVSPHVELGAFIELRIARSSQRSGSPSAILKANRSRGRRTGLKTRRSDTFSVFERARWLASTSRVLPRPVSEFAGDHVVVAHEEGLQCGQLQVFVGAHVAGGEELAFGDGLRIVFHV